MNTNATNATATPTLEACFSKLAVKIWDVFMRSRTGVANKTRTGVATSKRTKGSTPVSLRRGPPSSKSRTVARGSQKKGVAGTDAAQAVQSASSEGEMPPARRRSCHLAIPPELRTASSSLVGACSSPSLSSLSAIDRLFELLGLKAAELVCVLQDASAQQVALQLRPCPHTLRTDTSLRAHTPSLYGAPRSAGWLRS